MHWYDRVQAGLCNDAEIQDAGSLSDADAVNRNLQQMVNAFMLRG